MRTNLRPRWLGLPGLSFALGALLYASTAFSQDEEATNDEGFELEEVIVTGTRIKRRDFSSPSPLVTVSRQDLEFSGQPTLEEYFNQLPQMQPVTGRAQNNGGNGTQALNLRGMGPGRTLVLLNGRRVAPSGTGSAVDVNNLPSTLIERVEIITGGASTVYGSDAIAGVVNFITRDDFSGLSVEGGYNITGEGDANIWDANAVYGLELPNGGNISFYAGRYEREELFASEREISAQVFVDDWVSGEFRRGGSSIVPGAYVFAPRADLGDGLVNITWDPDGTPRAFVRPDDLYNYQPVNYLQTPLSRDSLGVLGDIPLSGSWEFYFEAAWARNEAEKTLAPAPYVSPALVNIDNPFLTPETRAVFSQPQFEAGPGLAGMFLGKRLLELGPRIISYDREYTRLLAGLRGVFGDGWDLDAWVTYTDGDEEERTFNSASFSRFQQGLLVDPATGQCFDTSGGCVPVNVFGEGNLTAEALDFIRSVPLLNTTTRTQWLASVVATGQPFDIWTGPVDMSFGVEWRSDEAHFAADPISFTGDTIGINPDSPIDGTESVYELYSEAIFSLYESDSSDQSLELEIGGRWSHYDNAGNVETWKAGLNWQLTESLRFRSMFQHAVRAPNNAELFTAQLTSGGTFVGFQAVDPCSASQDPVGNGNADKCIIQGLSPDQIGIFEAIEFYPVDYISGGNPNLLPESSDTFTVGAVLTPQSIPGLTITLDYYDLEIEDTIGDIAPDVICFDPVNTAGVFCENLQRDATGNVSQITALTENRGLLATDGIDLQVQYQTDLPASMSLFGDYAGLTVGAAFTHLLSLNSQENVVSQVFDCNGRFGWPCNFIFGNQIGTYPENKLLSSLNYVSGPFTANLSWRWIYGSDNAAPIGSAICCGITDPNLAMPSVSSWNYFDLGLAYEWDSGLLVRLGINNLLDEDPPLMGNAQFENNTDALLYDVFGRTYYLNLRYQFGF